MRASRWNFEYTTYSGKICLTYRAVVVVVVVEVVAVVVAQGAAAGYQCGFCVNAAGPAVQVLGHRVALC